MRSQDSKYFGKWEERYKQFPHLAPKWHRMKHQINHPDREWMYKNLEQPVLDAGCGNAVDARGFTEYVGVDVTPSLLKAGKFTFNVENLVYADARYMPFRRNIFQTSFAKDLLLHMKLVDAVKVLRELIRIGRKTYVAWGIEHKNGKERNYAPTADESITTRTSGFWYNCFSRKTLNNFVEVGKVIDGTSITEVKKKRSIQT